MMMMSQSHLKVQIRNVTIDEDGMRLDRWFKRHFPALKFGQLQKLLRTGQVRLDGKRVKTSARVSEGQAMRVPPLGNHGECQNQVEETLLPQEIALMRSLVIHEDNSLIVLNKPSGIAVQGGSKTTSHIDHLLLAFGAGENKPRLVHRLDRDTSGVLLVAKSRKAAASMGEVFRTRSARKIYWALTGGVPRPHQGEISAFLRKHRTDQGEKVEVCGQGAAGGGTAFSYLLFCDRECGTKICLGLAQAGDRAYPSIAGFYDRAWYTYCRRS